MFTGLIARMRSLWHGARRRDELEAGMEEELRQHVELRAADLVRTGVPLADALRRARQEFGSPARYREEGRRSRGLHYIDAIAFSWLDVKLGVRMLMKYPGLALVCGIALAAAIGLGAFFDVLAGTIDDAVPFEEGERVVAIENMDTRWNDQERQILHDFAAWRRDLTQLEDVSAFRLSERNLVGADGVGETYAVAEMTASAFRLTRVTPVLGRALSAEDERADAPAAVVIGYDVWQRRFGGDRAILGRTLQLGDTRYTVAGVMPEGFGFPISHEFWVALRPAPADYAALSGPQIYVAARLAAGATMASAQAELSSVGQRMAAAYPETHERLSPRIVPYTRLLFDDLTGWETVVVRFMVMLLLVVISVTVATLIYARTVTRRSEIAVRSALGAGRRRIVTQLFVEALVLTAAAAAAGVAVARVALAQVEVLAAQFFDAPFWMDFTLSIETILYVATLAILAAVVVGVVPALKATGAGMQEHLRTLGGGTGLRFGRMWTAMIVLQVMIAVALLPLALSAGRTFMSFGTRQPGYATEQFLSARFHMDRETSWSEAELASRETEPRRRALQAELIRRMRAEPAVAAVFPLDGVPGQEPTVRFELDGAEIADARVGTRRVHVDQFNALDVPLLAGRGFTPGDMDTASSAVIVNASFVQEVLRGNNALGRRIRYVDSESEIQAGRWYDIVGVVADYPAARLEPDQTGAKVYHALPPDALWGRLAIRIRSGAPSSFAPRLRAIATAVDPNILIRDVQPLDVLMREEHQTMRLSAIGIAIIAFSVVLLSAAGIFALMNFTVEQRRREIGIRSALGANPRQLLLHIFARAAGQLAAGIAAGIVLSAVLMLQLGDNATGSLVMISALMLGVGLAATVMPARRSLRIHPTDALRAD